VSDVRQAFAVAVRSLRKSCGLSQEEFAHRAGIDRTYASGIEGARRNPSLVAIGRISAALGVSLAVLFEEVDRELSKQKKQKRI
jgi:transcriptional regulator with XRE-family HTH domain